MRRIASLAILFVALPLIGGADSSDLEVVHAIKQEAFEHSRVMDHLFQLVDVAGNRLTGSPGYESAANWAAGQMREWGLVNVALEPWGPFGQGWSASRFSAHLVEPSYEALIGVPMGWTPGTDGVVTGRPVLAPIERESLPSRDREIVNQYVEKHRGKLGGQIVMIAPIQEIDLIDEAMSERLSSDELRKMSEAPEPQPPIDFSDPDLEIPNDPVARRKLLRQAPRWFWEKYRAERQVAQNLLNGFLVEEGVRLVIHPGRGSGGTVFPPRSGSRNIDDVMPPPSIALTPEQYNRIYRLVEKGIDTKVEVEVRTAFHRESLNSFNVIAEIPGAKKKDEIVMIGGHLDSVDTGLGATDDAAGCAVMMEAVRILKALNLRLDRTVRIALWSGEEQGLLGSKAYVKEHFGDPETMKLEPEHAKLSAYFNVDNGGGKIRGVYLQGNDMMRPIFQSWLSPFSDLGASALTIRDTGGTDHLSFDAVGLPGFQFIQDPLEYDTRTHHANMDVYDRIPPGDLMQAAAIVAAFVYNAANYPERLPRKPLPEPQPTTKPTE